MDLAGIAAALKGMFRLRPNNKLHQEMLQDLDELRGQAAKTRAANTVDEAIEMLLSDTRNA